MNPFHIVGSGLFALDVIVRSDGRMAKYALGGSAGNVLSILGALGWGITPVGIVGEDAAADVLQKELSNLGADLSFMQRSHRCVTPVIYQHQLNAADGQTHRFSFTCPHCGETRRPTHLNFSAPTVSNLPVPDVFFLDRATPTALAMARQFASEGGIVVFEPSMIDDDMDLFRAILQCAHVVKYAQDRISDLDQFDMRHVAIEIRTAGAQGLRFRTHEEWRHLEAFKINAVHDTAGAGDWCTAGLLFQLLSSGVSDIHHVNTTDVELALSFGQFLSALNCMTQGARGLLDVVTAQQIMATASELRSAGQHTEVTPKYRNALYTKDIFRRFSDRESSHEPDSRNENMFCHSAF